MMSLRSILSSFTFLTFDFCYYRSLHIGCGGWCIQFLVCFWPVVLVGCNQVKERGSNHDWIFWIEYVCCQGFSHLDYVVWLGLCSSAALSLEITSMFAMSFPFDPGGGCNCNNSRLNCMFYRVYGMVFLVFKYHILILIWNTNSGGRDCICLGLVEMVLDMLLVHACAVGLIFLNEVLVLPNFLYDCWVIFKAWHGIGVLLKFFFYSFDSMSLGWVGIAF